MLDQRRVDTDRLRRALAKVPRPKAAYGRLVLAVGVPAWLRFDAPGLLFSGVGADKFDHIRRLALGALFDLDDASDRV